MSFQCLRASHIVASAFTISATKKLFVSVNHSGSFEKRGTGIAGTTQMEQANTVSELKALLKTDYNTVMHLIDGESLSAKDFRGKRFELNGIKYKLEEVRVAYPVMVVDGKPATDFYLKLFCRNGHEKHEVLVCFPHEKQQQALDFYAAIDCFDVIRVEDLWDSDEDPDRDDYWGFVKTFNADKCRNPFSLLNVVCHCSDGIQDFLKCRKTSDSGLIEHSIRDFAACTDFMVDKALPIMQTYCREQCTPEGFDIFSTPIVEGHYKKDMWRSYVFNDEENDTCRGAFQITLRGGQRGWLIGNNEQELLGIAEHYPKLADPVADYLEHARAQRNFQPAPDYPPDRFYAWQLRELLGCLARISETPVVPADRQVAADFMSWGLREAECLGKRSLAAFKEYLLIGTPDTAS